MSSIVTFYSFKGGVGRTMALANIAVILVQRGIKVLAIDWDLEAPGLERYFVDYTWRSAIEQEGAGFLDLLVQAKAASSPENWPDWTRL
jgi:MinD-like ATPase involved in chromosome partitioning or flagellar assembly